MVFFVFGVGFYIVVYSSVWVFWCVVSVVVVVFGGMLFWVFFGDLLL